MDYCCCRDRKSGRAILRNERTDARAVPHRAELLVSVAFDETFSDQPASEDDKEHNMWASKRLTGEELAVVVTDLSGFTSTTRKYGIIHFASIIARKRQLCLPIAKKHGAVHVTTEADNLIIVFEKALSAAKASVEMQKTIFAFNDSLTEDRQHFKIKLNGIGVHCSGSGLIVDSHDELAGEAFREAYLIGEDTVEDGQIMVSSAVKERIENDPFFEKADFQEFASDENTYWIVAGDPGPATCNVVSCDADGHLDPGLLPLAQRHSLVGDALITLDKHITASNMSEKTVMMFNLELANVGGGRLEDILRQKYKVTSLIEPVLIKEGGRSLEPALWVFDTAAQALVGTLKMRSLVQESAELLQGTGIIGYGIHTGKMLIIDGTDIHWGDPVNTSSKLGQDLAESGNILITPEVKSAADGDVRCKNCEFEALTLERSNVEFQCFAVKDGQPSAT